MHSPMTMVPPTKVPMPLVTPVQTKGSKKSPSATVAVPLVTPVQTKGGKKSKGKANRGNKENTTAERLKRQLGRMDASTGKSSFDKASAISALTFKPIRTPIQQDDKENGPSPSIQKRQGRKLHVPQSPESDDSVVPLSPLALNSPASMRSQEERRKRSTVTISKAALSVGESKKAKPVKKASKGPLTPTPIASSAQLKKTWPVDTSETERNSPAGDQDEDQRPGSAPRVRSAQRSPARGKSKTTIRDTLAFLGPLLSAPVEDMLVLLYTKQRAAKNAWSEQPEPASTMEEGGFFQSWNARVRKMRATLMKGSSQEEIARGLFHLAMRFWDEQCELDGGLSSQISEAEDIMSTEELLEHLASELSSSRSPPPQVHAALEDVIQIAANSLRTRLDLSLHKSYRWTTNAADLRILYCLSDFPLARSMILRCKAECRDAPELTDVDKGAADETDPPGVGETGLLADVTQALELSFRGLVDLRTDAEKVEGRPGLASSSDADDAMENVIGFELPVMECLHILSHFAHEDSGGGPPSVLTPRRDAHLLSNVAMLTLLPIIFDVFSFAFNPTGYMNTSKEHRFNQFWVHVVECTHSATARAKSGEGKKGAKGDLWRAACCMVPPDPSSPFWTAMVNALGVAAKSDHKEVVSALLSLVEAFAADKSTVPIDWAKAQERAQAQAVDLQPKGCGSDSGNLKAVEEVEEADVENGDDDDSSELSIELD